jgi:DegV family protein with EDD domain
MSGAERDDIGSPPDLLRRPVNTKVCLFEEVGYNRSSMNTVAIVTDSGACMPAELVSKFHIHVVPFLLVWEGQSFRDGVDLTTGQFYQMLRRANDLPSTSQPSVGDFLRIYAKLSREAEAIVSIHVAGEMTGVMNSARTARDCLNDPPVYLIDSRTAAMAQGFIVLAAARAASEGRGVAEVIEAAKAMIPRVRLYAVLDTLDYLRRGGRVPQIAALAGSLLQINPLLSMANGRASILEAPRTKNRAVDRLLERAEEQIGRRPVHMAVFHADALAEAQALREQVALRFNCVELYVTEFTPVMGTHTGPGLLGLAFYTD